MEPPNLYSPAFPGDLDTVDLSADVDLIDDHREVERTNLSQRRQGLGEPGQPPVDDLGLPRVHFPPVEQPGGLVSSNSRCSQQSVARSASSRSAGLEPGGG